eukprot:1191702-Prorocentrum_minimum.AAC.1
MRKALGAHKEENVCTTAARTYWCPPYMGWLDILARGNDPRRDKRSYPGRGPIGGGTRRYTRGGHQSEEGQEEGLKSERPALPARGTHYSGNHRCDPPNSPPGVWCARRLYAPADQLGGLSHFLHSARGASGGNFLEEHPPRAKPVQAVLS